MIKNVWLLTLIQALGLSAGTLMVLVGGLAGSKLASDTSYATLPVAAMIVGTALGIVPVIRAMERFGRKPIFIVCGLLASLCGVVAAMSITVSSFTGFVVASGCLGLAISGFQQIRFVAMESVAPKHAPKAASTVLLGGLVAAFIGPQLIIWGKNISDVEYVGGLYLMAGIMLICASLFTLLKSPKPMLAHAGSGGRRLADIAKQPKFLIAVSSAVIGYALMSFIMTATPLHMHVMEGHSLVHTKWVIQSHIIAMFFPSFFSGWLITKLGPYKIIVAGLVIYLLTISMGLVGTELVNYWVALVLLGLGWNFLFVSGTVLLGQSHTEGEKFKTQSLNEFMVFAAQASAALGAGFMLTALNWDGLLLFSLSLVMAQGALIGWLYFRTIRKEKRAGEVV